MRILSIALPLLLVACTSETAGNPTTPRTPTAPLEFRGVVAEAPADPAGPGELDRQSTALTDPSAHQAALTDLNCDEAVAAREVPDGTRPLATCDEEKKEKLVLAPAFITGNLKSATSGLDPQGVGWTVTLDLNPEASAVFGKYTSEHVNERVAIVLDGVVLTAPSIQGPITGTIQLTGGAGGFTRAEAEALVGRLHG